MNKNKKIILIFTLIIIFYLIISLVLRFIIGVKIFNNSYGLSLAISGTLFGIIGTCLNYKEKNAFIRLSSTTYYLLISLLSGIVVQLYALLIWSSSFRLMIIICLLFYCSLIYLSLKFAFYLQSDNFWYKLLVVFFGIFLYMLLLFDASLIFTVYYSIINPSFEKLFIVNEKDLASSIIFIFKNTAAYFYNYPSNSDLPISYYLPYFFGKFIDFFLLGYIFTKMTSNNEKNLEDDQLHNLNSSEVHLPNSSLVRSEDYIILYTYTKQELDQLKIKYTNLESKYKNLKKHKR